MQELEIQVEPEEFVNNINFNYNDLENKPSINEVPLEGNKSLKDLGIQPEGDYVVNEILNNKVKELNDKDTELNNKITTIEENYITKDVDNLTNYKNSNEIDNLLKSKADKTELPKNLSELNNDAGFIKKDAIPTKNSQLQNDSGYITANEIPTEISSFENDANYAKVEQIPTNVSDLINDSEFITKIVDNLINYYKKTETYTKDEVNKLIENIKNSRFKKSEVKPEVGEENIIYLIPSEKPQEENIYDEFIYTESKWEKIGSTKMDFSDYTDNEQLNELLSNYVTNETFTAELKNKLDTNSSGYIKKLSIEGKTITYTRGDDTTGTLETKDTTYQVATGSSDGLMSSQDKSKLDTLEIPTQLSDLTNDTGFITSDAIPTDLSSFSDDVGYAKTSEIPTSVSELDNDSGYLTEESDPTVPSHVKTISVQDISNWNNKATQQDIDSAISKAITSVLEASY